ncbi:proteoglycan Cow [Maniola jurtina]|uniref:proteoglycan Cow n=1 Tax=Maniola jurtina TaxID=191418 RepID=UPI001E68CF42|nr:proteoglycan Cow [Maniola jurtina]
MRLAPRAPLALLALSALAAAAAAAASPRKHDQDFEFDDAPEAPPHARRPRRYVYDPDNPLCRALVCEPRETCLLRDAFTALCARRQDVRARGDTIVAGGDAAWERGDDDDVFYEARADHAERAEPAARAAPAAPDRCVGCARAARGAFLCGSDNRTYSSLCRLDLHNCVRRAVPPVRLACRGFCPCRAPAPEDEDRRRRPQLHNDVHAPRARARRPAHGAGCALERMADRLLDWFAVLMDDAGAAPPPPDGFPRDCKPEVRWMFEHLDAGRDGALSAADLYALRHDERERCLRPFLATCGARGGRGARGVTRAAWCACLRRAARPCAALARAHPAPPPGAYVPACDARGWYRARQCHAALGVCWCVDAHGVERPGSRTKGAPLCPGENETDNSLGEAVDEAAGEAADEAAGEGRAPDDDEDVGGSGDGDDDNELRF